MEQLIVLGQIPGTHIRLTYTWFQVLLVIGSLAVAYRVYRAHLQKQATSPQRHFDVISLRSLDQA